MPRPLTAADRSPENGDCLVKPGGDGRWRRVTATLQTENGEEYLLDHWNGKTRTWFRAKTLQHWCYHTRRDKGPITIEGEG